MTLNLTNFNNDLLLRIFHYVDDLKDLSAINRVNKKWNIVSKSDALWLPILEKILPNEYKKYIELNNVKHLLGKMVSMENAFPNEFFLIASKILNSNFKSIQKSIKFLKEKNPELHEKFSKLSLPQIKEKGSELINDLLNCCMFNTSQKTFKIIRKILNLGPNMNHFFQHSKHSKDFRFTTASETIFSQYSLFPSQLYHGVNIRSVFNTNDSKILSIFLHILHQEKSNLSWAEKETNNDYLINKHKWFYKNLLLDFEKFLQKHKINVNTTLFRNQTPIIFAQSMGLNNVVEVLIKNGANQEQKKQNSGY